MQQVLFSVELNGYPTDDMTIPVDGYMFYVPFHKPWMILKVLWSVLDFYLHDFTMKKTVEIKWFDTVRWVD